MSNWLLYVGKSHGWRSLVGCSPWGHWELDATERLPFHFSLPCIGEGNGNPLQCSCLENPRDGGAWWAAVYVTWSQTRLKRLSSSSMLLKYVLLFNMNLLYRSSAIDSHFDLQCSNFLEHSVVNKIDIKEENLMKTKDRSSAKY